jgi:hypothetical protein
MAFSIDHKVANNLCDLGACFRTISSAHVMPLLISHATANILSD